MPKQIKRQLFFKANRFQKKIIHLILLPCMATFVVLFLHLAFFHIEVTNAIYAADVPTVEGINSRIVMILAVLFVIFLSILLWAFDVSSKLVGAFDRILTEMDEVLDTGKKKHISARKDDELANELLKRINALIDKIPG